MSRIIDYTEASSPVSDDYLVIDGSTNGTRKIKPSSLIDPTGTQSGMAADAKLTEDKIEGIKSDFNANPFVSKSFVVPIGTIHFSTSNRINTDIKAGQSFAVIVESSETGGIIIVGYGDETTQNLSTLDYKGVAEKDIVYVGVYYDNRSGVSDVAIKFCIAKNPYGYDAVYAGSQAGNIINDIAKLYNSIFKYPCPLNRLYSDDDTWINHARYSATELIPINPPVDIKVNTNIPSGYHAVILYDSEKNVIGTKITNVNTTGIIETISEANCAYIRFQGRNLNFSGNLIDPTIYVYSSVNDRIVEAEKKADSTNSIILTKTSTTEFNIKIPCESGKVVRYDFRKDYKKWDSLDYVDGNGVTQQATNIVSSDLWNNYYVYNDSTGAYIAQGHSNFIIKKDDHYVGNGHGNEVAITFDILANGKAVNVDALLTNETIECGELRIIAKTKMFRSGGNTGSDVPAQAYPALDTSGNPIVDFIHCMDISYNVGNKILMQNKLIVQNDDTVLQECNGAMLECYFEGFSKVIVNNAENTQNNISSDGTVTVANGSTVNLRTSSSVYANTVEMFGINHYIKQSMLNNDSSARQKSAVTFVFYPNRLKSYFVPVATQSRYPSGQTADTFNEGDIISVTNERIVEI